MGRLGRNARLNLSIGLPLRNAGELEQLLKDLSDPASVNYRAYLTPEEFTERFGPTEQDYRKLADFVRSNGLTVTGTHPNRMLLDVAGTAAAVENALHVNLFVWNEASRGLYFAPDAEPSLDLDVAVNDISGLENFSLPRPMDLQMKPLTAISLAGTGSGPSGLLLGKDFRAAYAPGVTATGANQTIGLFELDGFYASDVQANFQAAGLPASPVQTVLMDGVTGAPGSSNIEVTLDIMMAAYMAPGAKIIVYEGSNWNAVLNRMATDNSAHQLSSSWVFNPISATTEQIFRQMIAQGQSFFQASGDSGAYTGYIWPPADNPNVTSVGGTALRTSGPGGAWIGETAWSGSGGGVSTTYAIPSYQQTVNVAAAGGSTSMRNIPDVALTAEVQMYLIQNNGQAVSVGGTSAAAPLWAGFMALANEQAGAAGRPPVGFLNPLLYAAVQGATPDAAGLHDVVVGSNSGFNAAQGFDLTTGWGTPAGQKFLDQFAGAAAAPSFLLSAASANLTVAPGDSVSTTITTVPQNGFTGTVKLSVSGAPSGVTATLDSNGLLKLSAASSAATGAASLVVTGTSGAVTKTLTVTLNVVKIATFSLAASPDSLSLAQSGHATSTITATPQNGFNGTVSLSVSGLPATITSAIGRSGVITFTASSTVAPGSYKATISGTSGTLTKSATVTITVAAVASFTVALNPSTLSITAGGSGSAAVTAAPQNGFSGKVSYAASGLPAGVSASFSSTGTLTLIAAKTAAAGTSTITITGTSGSLTSKGSLALTVNPAPSFGLTANPASVSVLQAGTATVTPTVNPQNGFSGKVTFAVSGLPAGVTGAFSSAGVLTLSATATAAVATATATITGTSGELSAKASLSVTVAAAPDFALTAGTANLTVLQGLTGTGAVGVSFLRGFSTPVTLTVTGLPAGVTAAVHQVNGGGVATVAFSAASSAKTGATAVTITGTAGALTHTAKINLTVAAATAGTTPIDLTSAFNLTGIAIDTQTFTGGGLDGGGRSYSGYLLGAAQTVGGVTFAIGPMGAGDAVTNKTISLPAGRYTALKILAAGVNGNQPGQAFTITYADGSKSTVTQSLSDWGTPQRYTGESTGVSMAYRDNSTGTTDGRTFLLYAYTLPADVSKTVASLQLPASANVAVLAVTAISH